MSSVWRQVQGFPDLAELHRHAPARYPHLLETVAQDSAPAGYDILFAFPGDRLVLNPDGQLRLNDSPMAGEFLEVLDRQWQAARLPEHMMLPLPFHGGWFIFLAYELARFFEKALAQMPRSQEGPLAMAVRFPAAVVRDHANATTILVCERAQADLLDIMEEDIKQMQNPPDQLDDSILVDRVEEESSDIYRRRFARALDYIHAGDSYQVNLSRLWCIRLKNAITPIALYKRLRLANPAPFAGLATLNTEQAVICSSPERLVRVHQGQVSTRPIAGTHPRSQNEDEDRALARALASNTKERAEHIMLVDLERNDLGRICRPGSVQTDETLHIESYRHVHHLVSNIHGELKSEVTPGQVIRAVFPGGTITGCPKLRTMQIIAELEETARGAYTGSMGYLNRDGSLDLNILIRTLVLTGDALQLRAGGGIVADSDVERELQETRVKARGLLAACGISGGQT